MYIPDAQSVLTAGLAMTGLLTECTSPFPFPTSQYLDLLLSPAW